MFCACRCCFMSLFIKIWNLLRLLFFHVMQFSVILCHFISLQLQWRCFKYRLCAELMVLNVQTVERVVCCVFRVACCVGSNVSCVLCCVSRRMSCGVSSITKFACGVLCQDCVSFRVWFEFKCSPETHIYTYYFERENSFLSHAFVVVDLQSI